MIIYGNELLYHESTSKTKPNVPFVFKLDPQLAHPKPMKNYVTCQKIPLKFLFLYIIFYLQI